MAFYQSLAYEASAGSGKTFALVIRYISLLYLGAKPGSILTLTFTNKAANEMQVRISTVLAQLHLPQRENERRAIAQTLEITEEEVLAGRQAIYDAYLQSDLKISTIDKFFAQILRLFSQHLGLMPDFTIDELQDEQRFMLRFIANVRRADAYRDLVLFSARESKRLSDIFSFLSGLYTKDAELAPFLQMEETPPPSEKEILRLVASLRMLFDDHCPDLSPRARKTLENIDSIEALVKKGWLVKESFDYWDYKKCYTPQMDTLLQEIKEALARYFIHKESFLLSRYFRLYRIYKTTLLEENIDTNTLAFNDVTNLLYTLLHEKIDRDFLYFRLDGSIDHLLIDEFQDTNIVQYRILSPIIEEIHAGVGSGGLKSFFYVGDIKQSIYRFRGGAKELFHYVANRFGVRIEQLNTNYRSDCEIVKFVNDTFREKIAGYHDQQCKDPESGGYVQVTVTDELLETITDRLFSLLEQGVPADDIAILTYTNADAYQIEEALLQRDPTLKITTQTSIKLINNRYVSAVIEFLKYLYFHEEICKANFLTQIGKPWSTPLDISPFNPRTPLPKLVKEIIRAYQLPGDDRNLLKLIEVVSGYKDIEAFLFESETLNVDSPSKKSEGIRILTIHKSKGLEFKHVIVSDRFKKKNTNRSTLIFSYDEIALKRIFLRITKRDSVDKSYQEALQQERQLSLEDELNALYVAFTRAEHSLTVVCNENEKESAFSILGLSPLVRGKLPIMPHTAHVEDPAEARAYAPLHLGLQEQKGRDEERQREDIYAINYGNALHYMLEVLDGFSPLDLDNAYWAMKNRFEMLLKEGDAESIKARVARLLEDEQFLALTKGTISKEQPLLYNNELRQIDLLVEKEARYVVIDYKSSETVRSEHRRQVRHYKEAVATITGKPTDAYLCYVGSDRIELIEVA